MTIFYIFLLLLREREREIDRERERERERQNMEKRVYDKKCFFLYLKQNKQCDKIASTTCTNMATPATPSILDI